MAVLGIVCVAVLPACGADMGGVGGAERAGTIWTPTSSSLPRRRTMAHWLRWDPGANLPSTGIAWVWRGTCDNTFATACTTVAIARKYECQPGLADALWQCAVCGPHPADFCFALPENASYEEGALCEPLSVGVHAVRRAGVAPGKTVAIMGAGPVGTLPFLAH